MGVGKEQTKNHAREGDWKKLCKAEMKKTHSYRVNCTVGLTNCTCLIEWHLVNHFKLHTLIILDTCNFFGLQLGSHFILRTNLIMDTGSQTSLQKNLMDNHDLKEIIKTMFAPVQKTLPLFKLNLDFLQAVKVTKSSHHLFHNRASKGHESILCLTSKSDLHCRKSL